MPAEDAIFFDQIGHGLVLPLVEPADSAAKSQRRDVALSTAGKSIPLPDVRALKTLGRAMRQYGARVGQTQVINGDRLSGSPVTLQLTSVPEKLALDVILRSATGYIAALRRVENLELSFYERILELTTNTTGPPPQSLALPSLHRNRNSPPGRKD